MIRALFKGLITVSTLAYAARQFSHLAKDVNRYNAMRAMSGDPPLFRSTVRGTFDPRATNASAYQSGPFVFLASLVSDGLRYLRIRSM